MHRQDYSRCRDQLETAHAAILYARFRWYSVKVAVRSADVVLVDHIVTTSSAPCYPRGRTSSVPGLAA